MSTKNLARTVVEGGRGNKWERRESSQIERVRTRMLLKAAVYDSDVVERKAMPKRRPIRPAFSDKLGPVEKWIEAQDGRHWDDVVSDLHKMVDVRTVAGWHLIHGHVLRHMVDYEWHVNGVHRFIFTYRGGRVVGRDGVLRVIPRERPAWRGQNYTGVASFVWEWAAGRLVRHVGSVAFWYIPTKDKLGFSTGHRQGTPLSKKDHEIYDDLNDLERHKLTGIE